MCLDHLNALKSFTDYLSCLVERAGPSRRGEQDFGDGALPSVRFDGECAEDA